MAETVVLNAIWRVWFARQSILWPRFLCGRSHFSEFYCSRAGIRRIYSPRRQWERSYNIGAIEGWKTGRFAWIVGIRREVSSKVEAAEGCSGGSSGSQDGVKRLLDVAGEKILQVAGFQQHLELQQCLQVLHGLPEVTDLAPYLKAFCGTLCSRDIVILLKSVADSRVFPLFCWVKSQAADQLDRLVCLAAYRRLLEAREWKQLEVLVHEMRQRNFLLDGKAYCRIIKEASDAGRLPECEKWFRKMKDYGCKSDTVVYNTLMHAYAKRGMHERVFSTYEEMQESGFPPDMYTYCHLLSSCRTTKNVSKATRLFNELKSSEIPHNYVPGSILLDIYGKAGQPAEAAALFKSMQEEGLQLDAKTYNCLIHAFTNAGMVAEATLTFQSLCRSRCRPDEILCWTMLRMYCNAYVPEQAISMMRTMRRYGIKLNEYCFSTLMTTYIKLERWEDAFNLLQDWQISGCPISEKSSILILFVLSKSGQHVACERLFEQMIVRKGYTNNLAAYEIMIGIFSNMNNLDKAMSTYNFMKANGCSPNVNILTCLISLNAAVGNMPVLNMLRSELSKAGLEPDEVEAKCAPV